MRESGIVQKTKILKKGFETAGDDVAKALFLGSNNKVIVVHRVRAGDGTPLIYEESYLPYDKFKGILDMDLSGSMYKIMSEQFGVVLARSKQTISSINLDPHIAK
ncbi:UTRA domain-containing protein, partial [Candidatus Saccharibacteria bacterium]|nr:UTRA domain-containing protein [Candidatus Saccharibacteria bacterium]